MVRLTPGAVLALAGVAGLVVYLGARKVGAVAQAVNPLNHDNVFAQAMNDWGATIYTAPEDPGVNGDGSWSLGGWIFDVMNPDTARAVRDVSKPVFTGGATGSW